MCTYDAALLTFCLGIRALPPQGILKLLPRIIDDLRQENTPSFMVAVKVREES